MNKRGLGKHTPQMRAIIAQRYAEGNTLRQIGAELGRHHFSIRYHLVAMGIPRRPIMGFHPGNQVKKAKDGGGLDPRLAGVRLSEQRYEILAVIMRMHPFYAAIGAIPGSSEESRRGQICRLRKALADTPLRIQSGYGLGYRAVWA